MKSPSINIDINADGIEFLIIKYMNKYHVPRTEAKRRIINNHNIKNPKRYSEEKQHSTSPHSLGEKEVMMQYYVF